MIVWYSWNWMRLRCWWNWHGAVTVRVLTIITIFPSGVRLFEDLLPAELHWGRCLKRHGNAEWGEIDGVYWESKSGGIFFSDITVQKVARMRQTEMSDRRNHYEHKRLYKSTKLWLPRCVQNCLDQPWSVVCIPPVYGAGWAYIIAVDDLKA